MGPRAMRRSFGTVLCATLAMGLLWTPVVAAHATTSAPVTIRVLRNGNDTWWAEGAFVDQGTFVDDPGFFAGQSNTYHVFRTFTAAGGAFVARADVRILPTSDDSRLAVGGPWAVVSSTGDLAGLHGAGWVNEVIDLNVGQISGSWSGSVQL